MSSLRYFRIPLFTVLYLLVLFSSLFILFLFIVFTTFKSYYPHTYIHIRVVALVGLGFGRDGEESEQPRHRWGRVCGEEVVGVGADVVL